MEGSQITDAELEAQLRDLSIAKLEERDQHEVTGYFKCLEHITELYSNIDITETSILHLHNLLINYRQR